MYARRSSMAFLVSSLLLLAQMVPASAGTLSLDTGKLLQLDPDGSGTFTFSATTGGTEIAEDFLLWNISFQAIPVGSVSGILSIGAGTEARPISAPVGTLFEGALTNPEPSLNPVFTPVTGFMASIPGVFTLANSASINGLTTYVGMAATATDAFASLAANTSYGLASVSFSVSGGAPGDSWTVFAVQQQGAVLKTYWWDADGNDLPYTNLPFASGGNYAIEIGTITVAPIPEPSSLMLASSAVVVAAWCGWRRRSRQRLSV